MIRFIQRIWRLLEWIPVIWKTEDWDYYYVLDTFSYHLSRLAKYIGDHNRYVGAQNDVSRINTAIRLIQKVKDEEYALEYQKIVENKYGESSIEFVPTDNPEVSKVYVAYGGKELTGEDEVFWEKAFNASIKKQKKAERILWKFIEHNIQKWWD